MEPKWSTLEAVVQTAEGDVKVFAGVTARFVTAHPRLSVAIATVLGFVAGALIF